MCVRFVSMRGRSDLRPVQTVSQGLAELFLMLHPSVWISRHLDFNADIF